MVVLFYSLLVWGFGFLFVFKWFCVVAGFFFSRNLKNTDVQFVQTTSGGLQ